MAAGRVGYAMSAFNWHNASIERTDEPTKFLYMISCVLYVVVGNS